MASSKHSLIHHAVVTPQSALRMISQVAKTKRSIGIWGPMGSAKSDSVRLFATEIGAALVDTRLGGMLPEDLQGIPYLVDRGGVQGSEWQAPFFIPRDLDFSFLVDVDAERDTLVHFYNPRANGNLQFYCTEPEIMVLPVDKAHTGTIHLKETHGLLGDRLHDDGGKRLHDRFILELTDESGKPVAGKVRVAVKGRVKVVWVFEELSSANEDMQAATYEVFLEHRVGAVPVGRDVIKICTGNLEGTGGHVFELLMPLGNRMAHYVMEMPPKQWIVWAEREKIDPRIVSYIEMYPSHLSIDDAKYRGKAANTPRSWTILSEILQKNPDLSMDDIQVHALATVGPKGMEFVTFLRTFTSPVSVMDVLDGKISKVAFSKDNRLGVQHWFNIELCRQLQQELGLLRTKTGPRWRESGEFKVWLKRSENFFKYLNQSLIPEQVVASVVLALHSFHLPFDEKAMPSYKAFVEDPHMHALASVQADQPKKTKAA